MFNLKKAEIYQAVLWEKMPLFRWAGFLKKLLLVTGGICAVSFVGLIIGQDIVGVSDKMLQRILGSGMVCFVLAIIFWYADAFFENKIKRPRLERGLALALSEPTHSNLAQFCDFESAKALARARQRPDHLLLALLNSNPMEVRFVFNRALINRKALKNKLKQRQESEQPKIKIGIEDLIMQAGAGAMKKGNQTIKPGDFLSVLAVQDPIFERELIEHNLRPQDIDNLCLWFERVDERQKKLKKFWDYQNLLKHGAIGRDWASGYSLVLDEYSIDLTSLMQRNRFREIVGHTKEIKQIQRALSKAEQNNVLLVGRPGTGRTSILKYLAQLSFLGWASENINYKRIISLDLSRLAAQITSPEEVEKALTECFDEVVLAGNIILVIEGLHKFLGQESNVVRPGAINIAGVLGSYLQRPDFQIIAVTSYEGLHQVIETNPSLLDLFEKVEVSEISPEEALLVLEDYVPFFEQKYKKFISYQALAGIISLTDRYIQDTPFPKKALDALDEAVTWLSQNKKEIVLTKQHIETIIAQKTDLPLETIAKKEKQTLLNLEVLIHERIINQEEAVKAMSEALRRARADIEVRKGPMGSFLFLGPTGVGKTETCKALAAIYFRSEKRMIRLDMSEFQNLEDIKRLIGTYKTPGLLTSQVRETPFSLVLLDELEKAHPNILNLFLQVLDDGRLTDGRGRVVDFKNTIIIATSNAGAEIIRRDIAQDKRMDMVKEELIEHLLSQGLFRPEFINRFDDVVVFRPLSRQNLLDISELLLSKLKRHLQDKGIEFIITQELKQRIVELSYNPEFGAREMKRVIQDRVQDPLARGILSGEIKRGTKASINPRDFTLEILN